MKEFDILLVEDNVDHAELTQRMLMEGGLRNPIQWVKDGQEAVDYLFRQGAYLKVKRPGLVLLDIELPKLIGVDVLERVKKDPELCIIPVIMLTTSDRNEEVSKCYRLGANGFMTKQVNFNEFSEKINAMKLYWLYTNRSPV